MNKVGPYRAEFLAHLKDDWDAADHVDPDWLTTAFAGTPELRTRVENMIAAAGIPPWCHAHNADDHGQPDSAGEVDGS